MKKVLGLLVALVAMAALPSVAFAGNGEENGSGGRVCQGGTDCEIDQEQEVGRGGTGIQQGGIAGRDVNNTRTVNRFRQGDEFIEADGDGVDDDNDVEDNDVGDGFGVGGPVHGVESVSLARTGFDAWVLSLLGGAVIGGGIGLLAVQRRRSAQ